MPDRLFPDYWPFEGPDAKPAPSGKRSGKGKGQAPTPAKPHPCARPVFDRYGLVAYWLVSDECMKERDRRAREGR